VKNAISVFLVLPGSAEADALTAANRHARHGQRVRRVVQCVRIAANAARWLAGRLSRRV